MFDTGENFRVSAVDVAHHITVMAGINKRLNPGSNWFMEIGHNGNGNVEVSPIQSRDKIINLSILQTADRSGSDATCNPGPSEYNRTPD